MSRPSSIHGVPVPDEEPMPLMPDLTSPTMPPEEDDAQGRRKMDPELRVMAALLRSLEELEEPARSRVVAWLHGRHCAEVFSRRLPPDPR